jgi:hypothetical protein
VSIQEDDRHPKFRPHKDVDHAAIQPQISRYRPLHAAKKEYGHQIEVDKNAVSWRFNANDARQRIHQQQYRNSSDEVTRRTEIEKSPVDFFTFHFR